MTLNTRGEIVLNSKGESFLNQGRLSFYESCIHTISVRLEPGDIVKVSTENNAFAGIGYYNENSKIPLRILTKQERFPDADFWSEAIVSALKYRHLFYPDDESFRVVYGESDSLPGLIVDKFGDILSVQITTAGIERFRPIVLDVLDDVFQPSAIVMACNSLPRKKEGLPLFRSIARGHLPDIPFANIDGIEHAVNVLNGHKTGFFLDHTINRRYAAGLCKNKHVLDMFCYSGAFGIRAALNEAASVTCLDVFEPALNFGQLTAKKHGLNIKFLNQEAFTFLKNNPNKNKWDVIFLDPPSFVRGHQRAQRNISNYKKLILNTVQHLKTDGILVSSCCSFHVTRNTFLQITADAFHQANRSCRIFHFGSQSPDHPVNPAVEGTDYLKCFFIKADS
jgi:23S rRNA (cytosine1962-C5)-methyltransferase